MLLASSSSGQGHSCFATHTVMDDGIASVTELTRLKSFFSDVFNLSEAQIHSGAVQSMNTLQNLIKKIHCQIFGLIFTHAEEETMFYLWLYLCLCFFFFKWIPQNLLMHLGEMFRRGGKQPTKQSIRFL